jgi:hypothetical protein
VAIKEVDLEEMGDRLVENLSVSFLIIDFTFYILIILFLSI